MSVSCAGYAGSIPACPSPSHTSIINIGILVAALPGVLQSARTGCPSVCVGARIAQLVVLGLAVHSITGSILLWGHFPVEGIFPLELTWVQTPFPKNSFGWEYKPRSSLCTHAFYRADSKDPDVHVLDGWMLATKTHPACTHHPRRRNVTTLMVGLKNGQIRKNLTQKWWTPEI